VRPTARFALISLLPAAVILYLWAPSGRPSVLALYLLGPAAVGALLGWLTRVRIPIVALVGLPLAAIGCVLFGWSQYKDDGDSGPLLGLVGLALPLFAASGLAAGAAAGASWRGVREGVRVRGGYAAVDFGIVLALVVATLAIGVADVHPVYVVSGLLAVALLAKTRAWWAGLIVPFGFGVWASFVCLAVRTREPRWLGWAAAYMAPVLMGLYLIELAHGQDARLASVGSMLSMLAWGVGVLHALRIRDDVRLRLAQ
jgi:hypothetical protein